MARPASKPLTGRERDALAAICNTLGNGRVARAMGVNPSTLHRWLAGIGRPSVAALRAVAWEGDCARAELFQALRDIATAIPPGFENSQPL